MLKNIKNLSLMTKLLYLLALLIFVIWVIPNIETYYSNVNKYEKNVQELETLSSKAGITHKTKPFSTKLFKEDIRLLFSKVELKQFDKQIYEVHIQMKKEELKSFHDFIETISLRYYVQIQDNLEYTTEAETITVKMMLQVL